MQGSIAFSIDFWKICHLPGASSKGPKWILPNFHYFDQSTRRIFKNFRKSWAVSLRIGKFRKNRKFGLNDNFSLLFVKFLKPSRWSREAPPRDTFHSNSLISPPFVNLDCQEKFLRDLLCYLKVIFRLKRESNQKR